MAVQRYFGYLHRFAENPSKLKTLNLWLTATSPFKEILPENLSGDLGGSKLITVVGWVGTKVETQHLSVVYLVWRSPLTFKTVYSYRN